MISLWNATLSWNGLKENICYRRFYTWGCQNVSKKVLLTSKSSKSFWRLRIRRRSVVCPPSNEKGLSGIWHCMTLVLDTRFYILIMTLYYKMWQMLLQNATELYHKIHQDFWQKKTPKKHNFITKCNICCEMRPLLQISTVQSSSRYKVCLCSVL